MNIVVMGVMKLINLMTNTYGDALVGGYSACLHCTALNFGLTISRADNEFYKLSSVKHQKSANADCCLICLSVKGSINGFCCDFHILSM